MKRREFIKLLGGAAATWSLSAGPGYGDRLRRIGVLSSQAETDLEGKSWDATFRKRLDELGWVDGRNVHIDYRWGAGSVERLQLFAKELIRLNPEVVLTLPLPPPQQCSGKHTRSRLCLRRCPIRSVVDLS